ncbi:HXXEE domain-containing protein [Amycolatopsis plumensis]
MFGAWAIHDSEELVAVPQWLKHARPRLERTLPAVPQRTWQRLAPGQAHTSVAICIMGALVAAASAAGDRTGGRSPFFQAVLVGFGVHAVIPHIASAVVTRGYTPGLVTASTVVLPFSWWAWRELGQAGVEKAKVPTAALMLVPLSIGAAHAGAAGIIAAGRRLRARRETRAS